MYMILINLLSKHMLISYQSYLKSCHDTVKMAITKLKWDSPSRHVCICQTKERVF